MQKQPNYSYLFQALILFTLAVVALAAAGVRR